MIRAIVWKELREQGLIALTLLVLGSGVLVAAAVLADPPVASAAPADVIRFLGAGRLATLMLAVTAGMVCGGAVFAAEREAGTMAFLESLPASRWLLWRAKFAAGLGLTVLQLVILVAVAAGLGMVPTVGWTIAIAANALLAYVWGMFGSTTARTTLGSVGLAVPVAILTAFVALIPITLFFQNPGSSLLRPSGGLVFLTSMFLAPVGLSAWLFTGPDRARAQHEGHHPRIGLTALCWLTVQQLLVPGLIISAFALGLGLCLLAPGIQPFVVWPQWALAAGVLAGTTSFADEQTQGSSRFWAEQRLPLGRTWVIKIGLHLAFCLWLLIVLALPLLIRSQFSHGEHLRTNRGHVTLTIVFGCPLFDELGRQGWKYLVVPAVYGFAAGHLCGLLFRKRVVACGVAAVIGGIGAAAWGPSLLAGGVKHWQLWLPPLLTLATARLLMRGWAADQLGRPRMLATLVGGAVIIALAMGAGIGYRVLEIPDRPGGEDDVPYVAGLIPFDENLGGRDFKTAGERYQRAALAIGPEFDRAPAPPPPTGTNRRLRIEERLEMILRQGWPTNDPALGEWLDRMFASTTGTNEETSWYPLIVAAAQRPLGIYEHPQLIGTSGIAPASLEPARRMSLALMARALQKQARGESEALLPLLRIALSLARTLRNGSVVACLQAGFEIERMAFVAVDRWLDHQPPQCAWLRPVLAPFPGLPDEAILTSFERPELLRTVAEFLESSDPTTPFDPTPNFLAERYVLREIMKAPTQWLPNLLSPAGDLTGTADPALDLVGLAWTLPWERERTRRLIGLGFEAGLPTDPSLVAGRPGGGILVSRNRSPGDLIENERHLRAAHRACILKLALRAFRAERGKYPDVLAELTTGGYLHRLPLDPFDDSRGFGYRISAGETLRPAPRVQADRSTLIREEPAEVVVPTGQAIIWSVGADRIDQGGINPPMVFAILSGRPEDLVYLVPIGLNP